ncbi:hypothetical protein GJ496_011928 [Pomphorhynchus laevis]|nr:hypothetical protein GJ496_011928 [Pomphorhynchus laevis]
MFLGLVYITYNSREYVIFEFIGRVDSFAEHRKICSIKFLYFGRKIRNSIRTEWGDSLIVQDAVRRVLFYRPRCSVIVDLDILLILVKDMDYVWIHNRNSTWLLNVLWFNMFWKVQTINPINKFEDFVFYVLYQGGCVASNANTW